MTPRTGRPKKAIIKDINFKFRLTKETAEKLHNCAEKMSISKAAVIEMGINLVEEMANKKE